MCSPIRCSHEVKQKRFFLEGGGGGGGGGLFDVKFANKRIYFVDPELVSMSVFDRACMPALNWILLPSELTLLT